MGAKPTKEDVENLACSVGRVRGLSKEDLAGCVASLSDMAQTGIHTSLPEIRINGQPSGTEATPISGESFRAIQRKMKRRLERQMATNEEPMAEDVRTQLHLLDSLESQDDSADWASMRRWLVWCLHNNLDEEDEINLPLPRPSSSSSVSSSASSPRNHSSTRLLRRQSRVDQGSISGESSGRAKLKLQTKSSSLSFDSDRESIDRSGQNSFDSSGATGET